MALTYQLSTGRTVEIPLNIYLDMGDAEFALECQDLISRDLGTEYEIWDGSALWGNGGVLDKVDIDELEEESRDLLEDLDLYMPSE